MAEAFSSADIARVGLGFMRGPSAPVQAKPSPVRSVPAGAPAPQPTPASDQAGPALSWDEVLASPEAKNLSPEQLDQARRQYFRDVVAPHVPTEHVDTAWKQFDADTSQEFLKKVVRHPSSLLGIDEPHGVPLAAPEPVGGPIQDQVMGSDAVASVPPAQPPASPIPNQPPVADQSVAASAPPSQHPQVGPDGHMQIASVSPDLQTARDAERMKILQGELEADPTNEALKREIAFEQAKKPALGTPLTAPVEVGGKNAREATDQELAAYDAAHPDLAANSAPLRTPDTDKLIAAYSIHNNVSHDIAASEIAGIQAAAKARIDKGEDPAAVQQWASERYATPMGSVRTSTGRTINDYLLGLASGTATLLATPGGLANALTFGGYDAVLKSIFGKSGTQLATDIDGYLSGQMSDQTLSEKYGLSGEKGGVNVVTKLLQNPKLLAQVGVESAPSTLGLLGITRGAIVKAYSVAEKAALDAGRSQASAASLAREAATNAGEKANIVANGLMGAGQNALQTKQQVMAMPEPDLENSPIYNWLRKYVNAETAREVTANLAAEPSAVIAGFGDALATKFSGAGKSEAQILTGKSVRDKILAFRAAPTPEAIGSLVRPMTNEAKEEFLQSGPSEQGGQNVGMKVANPDQSLTDQVMEQGALGATLAVGQMAGMHVAGALVKPLGKGEAAPARVEPTLGAEPAVAGREANVASMPVNPAGPNEPVIHPPTITAGGAAADKGQLFHDADEPTLKTVPNVDSAQEPAPAKASVAATAAEDQNAPIPAADLLGHPEIPVAEKQASEPLKTPEIVKQEAVAPLPGKIDDRLSNPEVRSELDRMAKNAGWAEVGGRITRTPGENGGEIVGRTKWVPKEDWWQGRPGALNVEQTREAVRKAIAGEKLTKNETKAIAGMVELADQSLKGVKPESAADEVFSPAELQGSGIADLPEADQEKYLAMAEAVASPDDWATMSEGKKDAYLDTIFGPTSRPASGQETGTPAARPSGESQTEVAPAQAGQEVKVYNSRLPAMGQAGQLTKRTGQQYEAVPHPTEAGKWMVRPAGQGESNASIQSASSSVPRRASGVAGNEEALHKSESGGVQQLRRQGNQSLPGVVGELRDVSARHGSEAESGIDVGSEGQQRSLQSGELSVGNAATSKRKSAQHTSRSGERQSHDSATGKQTARHLGNNDAEQNSIREGAGSGANAGESAKLQAATAFDAQRQDAKRAGVGDGTGDTGSRATREAAARESDRASAEGSKAAVGKEVERFTGAYKLGLTEYNAKRVAKERTAEKPNLDWRVTPAPEFGPDRFAVVGHEHAVDAAAHEAATSPKNYLPAPTEPQIDAGNYKKGHVRIGGLDISIENPEGSRRRPEWPPLKSHYGYLLGTTGKDKDHVDVFVKPGTPEDYSGPVFVIDQKKTGNGHFDEHKVMLGWPDEKMARAGYLENYTKGWDGIRAITPMSLDEFKTWLKEGDTTKPANEAGDEKQAAAFSRVRGRGMSAEDINATIVPIKNAAKNLPPVVVLDSAKQAPEELRQDIKKNGAEGDVAGALHAGQIYLFADQIRDPDHAQFVLLHEATHFGLRALFGPEIDPVLMRMWITNPAVRGAASELIAKYQLSKVRAVEEVLADMGGKNVQPTVWQKLVSFVRDWLRRSGFTARFVKGLNDADIARILQQASAYWKDGKGKNATHLYRDGTFSQNARMFYSQLAATVAQKMGTAEPVAELKKKLVAWVASGAAKADELQWSGLKDWLDLQTGKVSKEAVLAYLRDNGVKVDEVELGGARKLDGKAILDWVAKEHGDDPEIRTEDVERALKEAQQGEDDGMGVLEQIGVPYDLLHPAYAQPFTKFSQYQLPGGENYRELLLTLPERKLDRNPVIAAKRDRFQQLVDYEEGPRAQRRDLTDAEVAERASLAEWLNAAGPNPHLSGREDNFHSGHFDEPNILAHVRFNERTDADGKRVLFIEEIQSDYAQKARKHGFSLAPERVAQLETRTDELLSKARDATPEDKQEWADAMNELRRHRQGGAVPAAPFVGRTEAWVALSLKRMIRYAAENGFDRVAWTNGEQQATRYDLSKKINKVEWITSDAHDFGSFRAWDKDNRVVIDRQAKPVDLPDLIGKDIADKLVNAPVDHQTGSGKNVRIVEGLDLKQGGEGMRAFYDKIVPNVANDVLKKLGGGRVGEVKIDTGEDTGAGMRDVNGRALTRVSPRHEDRVLQQPGFDITPALKERTLQGVPLFSRNDKGDLLKPYTDAELKAREEAAKKAEAEKAKEPPAKKVTADQLDLFNTQSTLFSRNSAAEMAAGGITPRTNKGIVSRYKGLAQKVIDFTDRLSNPLVDLPGQTDYLKNRQVAMGVIGSGNDVVKEIRTVFADATPEDRRAAFDFFTTEGATPEGIQNEKVRAGVQTIKDAISHVSDQLVDKGIISAEARDEFRDRYLPQLYLRHLLEDNAWKAMGASKKTSDMSYAKARKLDQFRNAAGEIRLRDKVSGKELSDEEVLKLGPVTDPEFLASVALARPMRDMAILDWLESISKDERWVLPNTTMQWNGKRVSPYFLKTEADRLRRQAPHYEPDAGKRAHAYADRMDAAANKALESLPAESEGFTQIPNTGRYGAMRGIWVRTEIYHDLVGNAHFQPNDMNWFQNLFGVGGIGAKATSVWKGTKTYLNPSGQVRNFVTNMTQLQLSGVPFHSLPPLLTRAIGEMKNKGQYLQEFKVNGGEAGTFANEDLGRMQRELLDMEHRAGELSTWGKLHRAAAIVTNAAGDSWQAIEVLGKLMKFMHERERGAAPGEAMIEANKTLFDYSLVQPWIRYARAVPFGIPFATWNAKVLPRLLETALLHPVRYLPYVALYYGAQYALASMLGVGYDDLEKLRKAMPQWLWDKKHAMLMPWKDAKGRWEVMDLSYFMPWTQWAQLGGDVMSGKVSNVLQDIGAFGGPIPNIISAISTQQDPFTHRDIANKGDPPMEQAASWLNYAWTLAAPPFLTDTGVVGHAMRAASGTTNKFGDPLDTGTQAALRAIGVNMYALTPEQTRLANAEHLKAEAMQTLTRLKQRSEDRSLSQSKRDDLEKEYRNEIIRRGVKLKTYLDESEIHPRLSTHH